MRKRRTTTKSDPRRRRRILFFLAIWAGIALIAAILLTVLKRTGALEHR